MWTAYLEHGDELFAKNLVEGVYYQIFQSIKTDSEHRFNPSKLRQVMKEKAPNLVEPDLPVIQQEEEPPIEAFDDMPSVEGIPF